MPEATPFKELLVSLLDHFCYQICSSAATSQFFQSCATLCSKDASFAPLATFFGNVATVLVAAAPDEKISAEISPTRCAFCGVDEPNEASRLPQRFQKLSTCDHSIHSCTCISKMAQNFATGNKVHQCKGCGAKIKVFEVVKQHDAAMWEKVQAVAASK